MSERFELPEEALPSIPPPPPLGSDEGTRSVGIATARLAVPDTLKLLSVAIPTPQAFTPESVVIPKAAPAPAIDGAPEREAPASDEALEAPAASQAPRVMTNHARRRQIVSALVLFVALVSASALALRLCADFLFR